MQLTQACSSINTKALLRKKNITINPYTIIDPNKRAHTRKKLDHSHLQKKQQQKRSNRTQPANACLSLHHL